MQKQAGETRQEVEALDDIWGPAVDTETSWVREEGGDGG